MKIKYANSKLKKSIFLAGPTPRSVDVPSWRPEALQTLKEWDFRGTVFVPESEDGLWEHNYDNQIHWEWEALNQCTVALFWVPRELEDMPAFTTNVEFGLMVHSSKVVFGRPTDAPKIRYLDALAKRYHIPIFDDLHDTLGYAFDKAKSPFTL